MPPSLGGKLRRISTHIRRVIAVVSQGSIEGNRRELTVGTRVLENGRALLRMTPSGALGAEQVAALTSSRLRGSGYDEERRLRGRRARSDCEAGTEDIGYEHRQNRAREVPGSVRGDDN